jgi:hypothetical protein
MNGKSAVKPRGPLDLTSAIIEYESGNLSDKATIELFQHLVDTGLAWQLQGHYGRTAAALLQQGLIKRKGRKLNERASDY